MIRWAALWALLALGFSGSARASAEGRASVVLVVGAPGEPEYGTNFLHQAELWTRAAEKGGAAVTTIGVGNATNDLEVLKNRLASEPTQGDAELWLVLIGHGTFDGKEARFNLRGPDVAASDLAAWLKPVSRPVVVVNTASSSAPFLNALSGSNRTVVVATRSGSEVNVTRFGLPFAEALSDPAGDLDHDGQVSVLEAFLAASRRVAEFYQTAGRLATEHALLDDTGDGLGTPADWFRGVRAKKQAQQGSAMDGARAQRIALVPSAEEQALSPEARRRRGELEAKLEVLRSRKGNVPPEEYYRELETLLLDLARVYAPTP
ncbi:MAG: hypothetical protein JNL10_05925 [Verrucomicrobiales bacterium]|nr:hypothetical protein [Verrucomicrobiales bacterium]